MADAVRTAYLAAVRLLARRELSEAQVRQRLARRHARDAVDGAIQQLRDERAIDDVRAAQAIARTQAAGKKRGELRVRRQIEQAGIAPDTARQVARDVFTGVDVDELIEAALQKRLRGRADPLDDAERRRLYRYLIGQGFESGRVLSALGRRKAR